MTTITIKRSSTASAIPLAGDLAVGELAVNLEDKRLFTKQSDGTVIELSTNPTDLDAATLRIDGVEITASATELNKLDGFTGSTAELNFVDGVTSNIQTQLDSMVEKAGDTMTGDLAFGDSVKATFGTDGDLEVYHDGTSGYIDSNASNLSSLIVESAQFVSRVSDTMPVGIRVGAYGAPTTSSVDLSHYSDPTTGGIKLKTTATGVDVTGTAEVDGLSIGGTAVTATAAELNYTDGVTSNIQTQLNSKASATASPTIALAGDATGAVTLTNLGNATLTVAIEDDSHNHIISNVDGLQTALDGKATSAQGALADSAVQTDDNVSFGTGSFSGEISANGGIALGDNDKATFGASDDLQIYHDGSHSRIVDTGTGNLKIQAQNFAVNNVADTENMITAEPDGFVKLFYNGAEKLATTSTGVDVTGTVTADGLSVGDTSANNYSGLSALSNIGVENADVYGFSTTEGGFTVNAKYESGWKHTQTGTASRYSQIDGAHRFYSADSDTADGAVTWENRLKIDSNGDVSFYEDTGTTAKMVWDASAESLGIGESSPDTRLDVVGGSADSVVDTLTLKNDSNGVSAGVGINFVIDGVNDVTTSAIYGQRTGAAYHQGSLQFLTNDSVGGGLLERMRIDSSGIVSFSETSSASFPARSINAYNNGYTYITGGANGLILKDAGASGSRVQINASTIQFEANGSERARIDSSGNLLVNTTTTLTFGDAKFQAKGDTNFWSGTFESSSTVSGRGCVGFVVQNTVAPFARFNHGNTLVGTISTNGSTTNYGTTSDYRLKENVVAMDNASDKVKALKPCRFNFIANPDTTVDGFLAHEAQEVVPEAVTGTKDAVDAEGNPEYQGIDQSKLVPLLTKALQEAITKIEQLETRIETLENN